MAKRKRKKSLDIGYNFRSQRFYSRSTGLFVSEKIAAKSPKAQAEKLFIEDLIEDYYDNFGDDYIDIKDFISSIFSGKEKPEIIKTDYDNFFEEYMKYNREYMDEEQEYG